MRDLEPNESTIRTPELLALNRLDESSLKLQRDGKYLEALEVMERALVLRQHFFGTESPHVWQACRTVAELCNLLAMTLLQDEKFKHCFELLKKAEILSQRHEESKAVTYNNLACYYRRKGKLKASLNYLQLALKLEKQSDKTAFAGSRADTHLNLCAVLSQLGRHSSALEQAQQALILLQEELFSDNLKSNNVGDFGATLMKDEKTIRKDRAAVLAIAYHNVGVENEFLRKLEYAIENYKKGYKVGKKYLSEKHGVTLALKNSLQQANKSYKMLESRRPKADKISVPKMLDERYKKFVHQLDNKKERKLNKKKWCGIEKAYGAVAYEIKPLRSLRPPNKKTMLNRQKKLDEESLNIYSLKSPLSTGRVQKLEHESKCETEVDFT